ncbi:hypothetical protein FA95DRAFT_1577308 [Auriscalpium vulgare]|uniref:Uncharacterized protein n=1 Tax=Auriscalpium vulgare TaxID=40419 RepID=A0ACB8R6Y8_9AGAM|nr:hypothetical protein FA95DRAFT_1577308 [Auriscalpium vulgare]
MISLAVQTRTQSPGMLPTHMIMQGVSQSWHTLQEIEMEKRAAAQCQQLLQEQQEQQAQQAWQQRARQQQHFYICTCKSQSPRFNQRSGSTSLVAGGSEQQQTPAAGASATGMRALSLQDLQLRIQEQRQLEEVEQQLRAARIASSNFCRVSPPTPSPRVISTWAVGVMSSSMLTVSQVVPLNIQLQQLRAEGGVAHHGDQADGGEAQAQGGEAQAQGCQDFTHEKRVAATERDPAASRAQREPARLREQDKSKTTRDKMRVIDKSAANFWAVFKGCWQVEMGY